MLFKKHLAAFVALKGYKTPFGITGKDRQLWKKSSEADIFMNLPPPELATAGAQLTGRHLK